MKGYFKFIIKTLLIFLVITASYFILILVPVKRRSENVRNAINIISSHSNNLVQNRLAYIELTRLDPNAPNFNLERIQLVNRIKNTNESEQKTLEKNEKVKIDPNLNETYVKLLNETQQFYKDQEIILEEVFGTETFAKGLNILKSQKSIDLLTRQTNIIFQFQWIQSQLKK